MKLAIKFTDSSASFTNGVEVGRIMAKMELNHPTVDNCGFPIHKENVEVLKRFCQYYQYIPEFTSASIVDDEGDEMHFDEWINFSAKKILYSIN